MDAVDFDCLFHVKFEHFSDGMNKSNIIDFDDELIQQADQLSSKWEILYRYSSLDEDVVNVSQLMQSTLSQQNLRRDVALNQDSIAEDHKVIFLDQKYFQFEKANKDQPADDVNRTNDHTLESMVFDTELDDAVQSIPETVKTPSNKTRKKKARNFKRNAHMDSDTGHIRDIPKNQYGAPPGVKVVYSEATGIDITKNSSVSLRFRL